MANTRKKGNKVVNEETESNKGINSILGKRIRLKCRNNKQKEYANLITEKEMVICVGPAGCGKSFIAISRAIELLQNKTNNFDKLILCKPAVEAGEKLGFLPGDLREKMSPILDSLIDIIDKIIGKSNRVKLENDDIIQLQTLAFVRGKTIDNAILVVDEAQNMTKSQMKSVLTRIGSNTKFIISGDLDQSDLFKDFKFSGLYDAWNRHKNISDIGFFKFDNEDIVRNPIIGKILNNYKDDSINSKWKKTNIKSKVQTSLNIENHSKEIYKIKDKNKLKLFYGKYLKYFMW